MPICEFTKRDFLENLFWKRKETDDIGDLASRLMGKLTEGGLGVVIFL